MSIHTDLMRSALNKLCKWRSVFVGWQLGTRAMNDPECAALRDQIDARLVLRAEVTALTGLLFAKGVFTEDEFCDAVATEATELDEQIRQQFPGFRTTSDGVDMDIAAAKETMRRLRFKP